MKPATPFLILVLGVGLIYPMQRWIDSNLPKQSSSEETLYFASGEKLKKMSVGFHGLLADVYWIRTLQYFGRKLIESGQPLSSATTANLRMDLLAPLLRIVVTLDPNHLPAYRFGAIFLPERDQRAAIELLEYGIERNPDEWRLYQDIGYIHWQAGDYLTSADWYERGSRVEGARWWMRDMAGLMRIKGGSREVARVIYQGYIDSEDSNIRNQAAERLKQLQSLDERDAINRVLDLYKRNVGGCPPSLRGLAQHFRAMGLSIDENLEPIDPDGYPYVLDQSTCRVGMAPASRIALE